MSLIRFFQSIYSISKKNRSYIICFLFLIIVFDSSRNVYPLTCDSKLIVSSSSSTAYKQRNNDRCEGFYQSKVSTNSFEIVGFTKGNFSYTLHHKEVIEVSSPVNISNKVHVIAKGIPLKLYYRMNADISHDKQLIWPLEDVIYKEKLNSDSIGIIGFIEQKNEDTPIYVPLQIKTKMKKQNSILKHHYKLIFRSSVTVENVCWKVSKMVNNRCNNPTNLIKHQTNSFRAGESITIFLSGDTKGKVCLNVFAKEKNIDNWLHQKVFILLDSKI
ncbi:hypothetical protein MHK_007400 [Candidatus Magnetomorum sp. HK-1]|nr:hypothetical protein MHK_007400 [Candidatus Magnetomorum sp. HK-1]